MISIFLMTCNWDKRTVSFYFFSVGVDVSKRFSPQYSVGQPYLIVRISKFSNYRSDFTLINLLEFTNLLILAEFLI